MSSEKRCPFKQGLKKVFCPWPSAHNTLLFLAAVFILSLIDMDKGQWASWVQAVGALIAIGVAIYIGQLPERRHRLEETKKARVMTLAIINIAEAACHSLVDLRDKASEDNPYGVPDISAELEAVEADMVTVNGVDLTGFPTEEMLEPFIRVKAHLAKGLSHAKMLKGRDSKGAEHLVNLGEVDRAANNMSAAVSELIGSHSFRKG